MHTFRIRSARIRTESKPKGFPGALELIDDAGGDVLVSCQYGGRFVLSRVALETSDGTSWEVVPNRSIAPTRWTVHADGRPVVTCSGPTAGSLINPLDRTSVVVADADDRESFRVMDMRKSAADRVIGSGPRDWMLMRDGEAIGKITTLSRPMPPNVGRIRRFFAGLAYDHGLVSFDGSPILPAPAALALVAIHNELTDKSAG